MDAGRNIEFVKTAARNDIRVKTEPAEGQEKTAQLDIPAYVPDMPPTTGTNTVQQVSATIPPEKPAVTSPVSGPSGRLDSIKSAVLSVLAHPDVRKLLNNEKVRAVINSPLIRTPTAGGLIGAAGTGLTAAALASAYRSRKNEKKRKNSFATNPVLLGLLGAAGGYVAGNKLNGDLSTANEEKETAYRILPKPVSEAVSKVLNKINENLGLNVTVKELPRYSEKDDGTLANAWHGFGTLKGKVPVGTMTAVTALPAVGSHFNAVANRHDLQSGFEAVRDRMSDIEKAKQELTTQIRKLDQRSAAMPRLKEMHAPRIGALDTDIATFENQLKAVRAQAESLDQTIAKFQARNQTVPQSLWNKKNNITRLINDHEATLRELVKDRASANIPVERLQKAIDSLTKKIEASRGTIAANEEAVAAQTERLLNGSHLDKSQAQTLLGKIGRIFRNLYIKRSLKGLTADEKQIWDSIRKVNKSRLGLGKGWLIFPSIMAALEGTQVMDKAVDRDFVPKNTKMDD